MTVATPAMLLFLCGLVDVGAAIDPAGFVGVFKSDFGLAGSTLDLREDGTFEYASWHCFGTESTVGRWRVIAPGVIETTSTTVPPEPRIRASRRGVRGLNQFLVQDEIEQFLPGAVLRVGCNDGTEHDLLTDARGGAILTGCIVASVDAEFPGLRTARYRTDGQEANDFVATLPSDSLALDHVRWLLLDDRMYEISQPHDRVRQASPQP